MLYKTSTYLCAVPHYYKLDAHERSPGRATIIGSLKYNCSTGCVKLQLIYLHYIVTQSAHIHGYLQVVCLIYYLLFEALRQPFLNPIPYNSMISVHIIFN